MGVYNELKVDALSDGTALKNLSIKAAMWKKKVNLLF